MADAPDLKSVGNLNSRAGSSPASGRDDDAILAEAATAAKSADLPASGGRNGLKNLSQQF